MIVRKDTQKHQGKRNQLVALLKTKDITDENVLNAIARVPRHLFLDSSFEDFAYQDKSFPIGAEQTISQPYTVAFQSQLLDIKKGEKVLEIGTGSGYQTAVLIELGALVYSIERQKDLFKKTSLLLPTLNYKPKHLKFGDGYKGLPTYAPFDKIIVTAGAPELPNALLSQLVVGGKFIIPLGKEEQIMTVFERTTETRFVKKEYGKFKFVPLLKNKQ